MKDPSDMRQLHILHAYNHSDEGKEKGVNNKPSSLQHCILNFITRQSFALRSIIISRLLFSTSEIEAEGIKYLYGITSVSSTFCLQKNLDFKIFI